MKKLSTVIISLVILSSTNVQSQTKSCCSANGNAEFAMLGSNTDFKMAHMAPEPINYTPTTGVDISFPTSDGTSGKAFEVKTGKKSNRYLLVIHEWWGLNDYIRRESERLATELKNSDVNVIAVDLYDGKVATNADDAGKYMQAVNQDRAVAIIIGVLNYIGPDAELQTIGWCFGGGWSLQAALLGDKQTKGCVMYYGMPEKDVNKLKNLSGPVLGIFAAKDGWINKQVVDEFDQKMKEAKKTLTVKWYNADHAFANPSNPSKYDKASADDANKLAIEFLRKNFSK